MNARFYNANTGRFLTQDTYKGNAWEPMSQNLYTYVGNNPINYIDPTGHMREKTTGGSGGYLEDDEETFWETCGRYLGDAEKANQEQIDYAVNVVMPAAIDAFEFELGAGGGIGGSATIAELLKINIIVKGDWWHIKYDDGQWQKGVAAKAAIGGGLFGSLLEGGYNLTTFKPEGGEDVVEVGGYGFFGLAAEFYYAYGGEIKVGIDIDEFLSRIEKYHDPSIYEKYWGE